LSAHDHGDGPDNFSRRERWALDQWRAPAPPDDLAAVVLSRLTAERAAPRSARPLAVAALALVLVGGLLATRLFTGGTSTWGQVGAQRALPGDGGSSAEVSALGDGIRS
jgi:hypothetical protein